MIEERPASQKAAWKKMKPAAQSVGDWLGLEVIVERSQITPTLVAPDLDHPGAEHDPENKRAKKPDDDERRRATRERPAIEERTKKNGDEAGFEELHFPAVAIPILAHMDERHVKNPEEGKEQRVRVAASDDAGEDETKPGGDDKRVVGMVDPKERWQPEKSS